MTRKTHDIIVIGAGSGGLTTAIFMQREGFKVLLIDRTQESFGGDCLNYGCVPSKALIALSKKHSSSESNDIQAILQTVHERQQIIRDHENPDYLRSLGIDVVVGSAVFCGKNSIKVNGDVFSAKKIIVATGSRPRPLQLDGSDTLPVYTNESIFDLKQLPKNFVFIGGGPIAIELGQAFHRLGSTVSIIQSEDRILARENPEVSELLHTALEKDGVNIVTNVTVNKVENGSLIITEPSGETRSIPADALFVGIGRIPNIDSLELESAGIQRDSNGAIILNSKLQSTNRDVFFIGDAAGKEMFTHTAELQAQLVLNNFFSPFKKAYSADKIGWTTFTTPEVGTFGLSKEQLQQRKQFFEEITIDLIDDDRAITEAATNGFLKLFASKKGLVLGGVMVGNNAGEISSELLLMMYKNISLDDVLSKPYPYPVGSRVIQSAAREFTAKQLYSKRMKRLLHFLYR